MTRKVEIATTAAASSWTDITTSVNPGTMRVGGQAFRCEVSAESGFDLNDDAGSVSLPSRRVVRISENASGSTVYLFRGRIYDKGLARGSLGTGNARDFDVALSDYNIDLSGIVVDRWSRPAETDYARLQALATAFLKGTPRTSTNLNTTTYVPNTNTVSLPAKIYDMTTPAEVITDLMDNSGKTAFVTVDGELFYDLPTSTAYASTITITDQSPNGVTSFGPIRAETAGEQDGSELYTRATLIKADGTRIAAIRSSAETTYDYWATTLYDDDASATTSAVVLAGFLDERSAEEVSYRTKIRLLDTQTGLIKWGQTLTFRSAAAGVQAGLTLRIARLIWHQIESGWEASLELAYPLKIRSRVDGGILKAGQQPAIPTQPTLDCVNDSFTRTLATVTATNEVKEVPLGTNDSGLVWSGSLGYPYVESGGSGSTCSAEITGGAYRVYATSHDYAISAAALYNLSADFLTGTFETTFKMKIGATTDQSGMTFTWQGYNGVITQITDSVVFQIGNVYVANVVGGAETITANAVNPIADGTWFHVRVQRIDNDVLRVRVWADGDPEPGTWLVSIDISVASKDWPATFTNSTPAFQLSAENSDVDDVFDYYLDDFNLGSCV